MKNDSSAVLACTGAVIGAGFASGKEIVVFFSRYGKHAGWLIVLAAVVMAELCWVCMRTAVSSGSSCWCEKTYGSKLAPICFLLLMFVNAGAMTSASGHMAALIWQHQWAYPIGAVGTLMVSWRIGSGRLKLLTLLSAFLTMALLCAMLAALAAQPQHMLLVGSSEIALGNLTGASVRAVGYAAMNMTLAIGVAWKSALNTKRIAKVSALFGWLVGILLLIGHYVYRQHPEVYTSEFPMVALLAGYGRKGYLFSVVLLYLAVFTTLTSVLYTIRTAVEARTKRWSVQVLFTLGLPMLLSCLGFSQIIERFYAPAGLVCLLYVFLPMARNGLHSIRTTTFS